MEAKALMYAIDGGVHHGADVRAWPVEMRRVAHNLVTDCPSARLQPAAGDTRFTRQEANDEYLRGVIEGDVRYFQVKWLKEAGGTETKQRRRDGPLFDSFYRRPTQKTKEADTTREATEGEGKASAKRARAPRVEARTTVADAGDTGGGAEGTGGLGQAGAAVAPRGRRLASDLLDVRRDALRDRDETREGPHWLDQVGK
jgi:hypothetical protein